LFHASVCRSGETIPGVIGLWGCKGQAPGRGLRREVKAMDESTTLVATLIPVFSLTVALVIVVVAMLLKSRGDARRHKERLAMLEKGMEIPRELYDAVERRDAKPNGYRSGRAWLMVFGCILVFVGLGVCVFEAARGGPAENGIVPVFIGLGFLAAERLVAKVVARPDTPDKA
jgi:hypothetical protein